MGRPLVQIIDGMKHCADCDTMLPIEMFAANARASSGLSAYCLDCWIARDKKRGKPRYDRVLSKTALATDAAANQRAKRKRQHQISKLGIDLVETLDSLSTYDMADER